MGQVNYNEQRSQSVCVLASGHGRKLKSDKCHHLVAKGVYCTYKKKNNCQKLYKKKMGVKRLTLILVNIRYTSITYTEPSYV